MQQRLKATSGLELTAGEIETNVELAKDSVAQALSELKDGTAAKAPIAAGILSGTAAPNGDWVSYLNCINEPSVQILSFLILLCYIRWLCAV